MGQQLSPGVQHRQRRPQLVGGVGDESSLQRQRLRQWRTDRLVNSTTTATEARMPASSANPSAISSRLRAARRVRSSVMATTRPSGRSVTSTR